MNTLVKNPIPPNFEQLQSESIIMFHNVPKNRREELLQKILLELAKEKIDISDNFFMESILQIRPYELNSIIAFLVINKIKIQDALYIYIIIHRILNEMEISLNLEKQMNIPELTKDIDLNSYDIKTRNLILTAAGLQQIPLPPNITIIHPRARSIDEMTCIICLENEKNTSLIPCGHVFCNICTENLIKTQSTCPYCRSVINGSLKVFLGGYYDKYMKYKNKYLKLKKSL